MKEKYTKPEVDVEKYEAVDVLTTSGENTYPPVLDDDGWINRWY